MKYFIVKKRIIPEWGRSTIEWERYFSSKSRETLESVLIARYGKLRHWSNWERSEMAIEIEEIEFEEL